MDRVMRNGRGGFILPVMYSNGAVVTCIAWPGRGGEEALSVLSRCRRPEQPDTPGQHRDRYLSADEGVEALPGGSGCRGGGGGVDGGSEGKRGRWVVGRW